MNLILKEIITKSGMALEAEDRYLLGSVTANADVYEGESGGILRINNERYYQFVVARALMSSLKYKVKVEVDSYDLVLEVPKSNKRFAIIEMKRWMSSSGEREIKGIKRDLFDKLAIADADLKLMMIFSANPYGQMDEQINWLSDRLTINVEKWEKYCFKTIDQRGGAVDYWVAGYQIE